MKILLPYISRSGDDITSKNISGGIEKFSQNLFNLFPDKIIPVKITKEDRTKRRTKQVFLDYVKQHKPDLILLSDIDGYFHIPLIEQGIPTIQIIHEGLMGDIRYLALYKNLHKFIEAGGHLYFVSENQYAYYDKHINRITGSSLLKFHGFINSSFATGDETVSDKIEYDVMTIGRTDTTKNPFFVHKKLKDTTLKTCVLTNAGNFQHSAAQVKYYEDNLHWKDPQVTFRGLPYVDTMATLSTAGCYISTCSMESWGITALEALARGIPLILVTDKSGKHSSQSIAADESHYRIVHSSIKSNELAELVKELNAYPIEKRIEISTMTKEKHSKEKFKARFEEIFRFRLDDAIHRTKNETSLDSFF